MIARLTGTLAELSADSAVIDVGGVGYQVLASARTLEALGPVGGDVLLLTELQVREDGWTLFGFGSAGERETFRILTSAKGVGPKLAARIANELQGKLGAPGLAGAAGSPLPRAGAAADAMSALGNLGFKPAEASAAVAAANEELGPEASLDALVRLALRKAAK